MRPPALPRCGPATSDSRRKFIAGHDAKGVTGADDWIPAEREASYPDSVRVLDPSPGFLDEHHVPVQIVSEPDGHVRREPGGLGIFQMPTTETVCLVQVRKCTVGAASVDGRRPLLWAIQTHICIGPSSNSSWTEARLRSRPNLSRRPPLSTALVVLRVRARRDGRSP